MGRRDYPERPLVGAGAVIVRGDQVVLVRRGRPPLAGEWSIPGGVVKLGETLRQAAEREAREETSLEIEADEVLEVFESITPDAQGKTCYHYVIVDFLCRLKSGELRAGSDAMEVKWCRAEELAEQKVSEAATKVILKALAR